jgi:hypothetical protein
MVMDPNRFYRRERVWSSWRGLERAGVLVPRELDPETPVRAQTDAPSIHDEFRNGLARRPRAVSSDTTY